MPPSGGGKRKRGDRQYSEEYATRPSPHRPGDLDLAQQSQSPSAPRNGSFGRGRGDRRVSRGGRTHSEVHSPNNQQPPNPPVFTPATPVSTIPQPQNMVRSALPIAEAQPPPPLPPRAYHYTILDSGARKDWTATGMKVVSGAVAAAVQQQDEIQLLNLVQELIYACCTGEIPPDAAGSVLKDASLLNSQDLGAQMVQTALLDAISVVFEDNQQLATGPIVELLQAAGIQEEALRIGLDQTLLAKLGLISGRFKQMSIRKTTNILYRQANFNLMREESEGFAKLITELFATSGNEPPTDEVIHQTVEKIKAMIGAFDLDVGRSLDVVLDIFGSVLVRHFRFLVKLLRASPWWPDEQKARDGIGLPPWAEPGGDKAGLDSMAIEEGEQKARIRDSEFWPKASEKGLMAFQQLGHELATPSLLEKANAAPTEDLRSQWIRATGTVPPNGNRDAAQLLGFKLRFYSSSAARDTSDMLPINLIHLSALLIKIGFISLNDLYSHIWRLDEDMEELKQHKIKEKAEKERMARPGAGSKNALAMAGALADDTLPAPVTRLKETATRASTPLRENDATKVVAKDPAMEPSDQKVMLLKSLLAVGALPEALFILGRFPWIMDVYPEVPEYIHRILHHCLTEVYESVRPLKSRQSLQMSQPLADVDIAGAGKGQIRLTSNPLKKTLKWANLDRDDSGDGTDYRFYWDDWCDNIPVCHSVDDVFTLCKTMLPLVGVKIGQDPSLVLKFTRIGKDSLAKDASESNKARWLDLVKRTLLPSLSLTKSNAGVVNEVFELINQYPTTTRYTLYLEWSIGRTSRLPDIKIAFDQARAETKDVLKRISKTNVKPMARALARIAYANPHIVISTALTQIEVYDSIAEVFVEGARYFTDLGYDVLTWALISSMDKAGRDRTQEGGIFASRWLSALSQFAGKIYKRYSMMKAGPILQYVADQLNRGNSTDLKMLEHVVSSMAGIATDTSFNDAQLLAMGGGPLLQSQTILQLLDRRNDSKTTSRRLIKSLQDHGLTAKFLVLMAQQRQSCVFEDSEIPLKAIGNTFDEINRVMTQYLDLLRSNLTLEEFQAAIPDISELIIDYQIPPEIAFWIARPVIAKQLTEIHKADESSRSINGEVLSKVDEAHASEEGEEDGEAIEIDNVNTPMTGSEHDFRDSDVDMEGAEDARDQWHPTLKPLMEALQTHLPAGLVEFIGVGFYVTFWQLSLYDISVPSKAYEDEMGRQKKKIAAVLSDRSNISASGAKTRTLQVKQYESVVDELLKENRQHLKSCSDSRARLNREKDHWFVNKQRQSEAINTALMEYCFLPRILCSPQDAFFCFKFLKFLHVNSTPNFRTLGFYDLLLRPNRLMSLVFMCTSKESDNLGRFLRELIQDLARWHKDKKVYEREAYGSKKNLIGFAMKVENGKPQIFLDFEGFRRLLFKWHSNIHSALTKCLVSAEYMHVRNAISILRALSSVFPVVKYHGTELTKAVETLRSSDREDLKVASSALLGALVRREKDWIGPAMFRQGPEKAQEQTKAASVNQNGVQQTTTDIAKLVDEGNSKDAGITESLKITRPKEEIVKEERARPASRPPPIDPARDSPRPTGPAVSQSGRLAGDNTRSDRRPGKPIEPDRPYGHGRRLSPPPRHTASMNSSSRSDIESKNGYRDGQRMPARALPIDTGRPDSRSNHGRLGGPDRGMDLTAEPNRHPRSHERMLPPMDRDERGPRRDYEQRYPHDDRRPPEREPRPDRDHPRSSERDLRMNEREHGRLQQESERRRADLLDDHHNTSSTPSASNRPPSQPVVGGINPDRAALIEIADQRPAMSIRGQAQDKVRTSRQSSPKVDDEQDRRERPDREDRSQRRPENSSRASSASQQTSFRPPAGAPYSRESRHYQQPPIDMQHGRLEPESPQRGPRNDRHMEKDVPSGPRQRGPPATRGRGGSTGLVPSPTTERPAPTGPARHFRNGSVQEPTSVLTPPDSSGVHPDRLGQITGSDGPRFPQRQPPQSTAPSGPRNPAIASVGPSTGPSPVPRGAPTGPQGDAAGRGRRHPLEALNTTLAQAQGPPAPSGRGRGGPRPGPGSMPPQTPPSGPSTRAPYGQSDTINPNGMPVQARPTSSRPDGPRDSRPEDDGRQMRNRGDAKDDRRTEEPRRNDRREEVPREARGGTAGDLRPRKHPREDGPHYGGYGRGGMRNASESKRPRRGG